MRFKKLAVLFVFTMHLVLSAEDDIKKQYREAMALLKEFNQERTKANDIVALAIPISKNRFAEIAKEGIDVLADHTSDPRAIETLKYLSTTDSLGSEFAESPKYQADSILAKLRANEELDKILKSTEDDLTAFIKLRTYLENNPSLYKKSNLSDDAMLRKLISVAKRIGKQDAMDMVVQADVTDSSELAEYFKKYPDHATKELFAHRNKISTRMLETYSSIKLPTVTNFFEQWLSNAETKDIRKILRFRAAMPDGRERIKELMLSSNKQLSRDATTAMASCFRDKESVDYLKKRLEEIKQTSKKKLKSNLQKTQ